ncbi:MAG TPA: hypothetical protein DCZ49_08390 [Hyphomonadaceae bacterium]|nr:hypothetical protein [Hyphomonadaceae bacterium]
MGECVMTGYSTLVQVRHGKTFPMNKNFLFALAILLAALPAGQAAAQYQRRENASSPTGEEVLPLRTIIQRVNARAPGRMLDADLNSQGNRPVYRIRWLTEDGRRIDFQVDARSGQVLSQGGN